VTITGICHNGPEEFALPAEVPVTIGGSGSWHGQDTQVGTAKLTQVDGGVLAVCDVNFTHSLGTAWAAAIVPKLRSLFPGLAMSWTLGDNKVRAVHLSTRQLAALPPYQLEVDGIER
jgi:hypothetical protein